MPLPAVPHIVTNKLSLILTLILNLSRLNPKDTLPSSPLFLYL